MCPARTAMDKKIKTFHITLLKINLCTHLHIYILFLLMTLMSRSTFYKKKKKIKHITFMQTNKRQENHKETLCNLITRHKILMNNNNSL